MISENTTTQMRPSDNCITFKLTPHWIHPGLQNARILFRMTIPCPMVARKKIQLMSIRPNVISVFNALWLNSFSLTCRICFTFFLRGWSESSCPEYLAELINDLKKIDPEQIQHLSYIVKGLIQNHSWCVVIKANSRPVWLLLFRQICCSYFLFIFFVNDIESLQHQFLLSIVFFCNLPFFFLDAKI